MPRQRELIALYVSSEEVSDKLFLWKFRICHVRAAYSRTCVPFLSDLDAASAAWLYGFEDVSVRSCFDRAPEPKVEWLWRAIWVCWSLLGGLVDVGIGLLMVKFLGCATKM